MKRPGNVKKTMVSIGLCGMLALLLTLGVYRFLPGLLYYAIIGEQEVEIGENFTANYNYLGTTSVLVEGETGSIGGDGVIVKALLCDESGKVLASQRKEHETELREYLDFGMAEYVTPGNDYRIILETEGDIKVLQVINRYYVIGKKLMLFWWACLFVASLILVNGIAKTEKGQLADD